MLMFCVCCIDPFTFPFLCGLFITEAVEYVQIKLNFNCPPTSHQNAMEEKEHKFCCTGYDCSHVTTGRMKRVLSMFTGNSSNCFFFFFAVRTMHRYRLAPWLRGRQLIDWFYIIDGFFRETRLVSMPANWPKALS